jgi:hypothetical protein
MCEIGKMANNTRCGIWNGSHLRTESVCCFAFLALCLFSLQITPPVPSLFPVARFPWGLGPFSQVIQSAFGRQILACWNNRSHVLQEKNPIYRHCTSKVICAGTTSYLLLGSVRVNVLREIDGWVQSQVCKCIELLSTYYSV